MGRKWNKKKKQGDGNKETKVQKPMRERSDPQGYIVVKKENKDFETFYKSQKLVPESEWDAFMSCLQSSLPSAFRITGNTTQAQALQRILVEDFFKPLENLSPEDLASSSVVRQSASGTANNGARAAIADNVEEPIKALEPKCLIWYPKGLAYQLNLSRRDIRRCEAYWRLHQCLIAETDTGSISRQEAVSMIPPLLLDVQPHHKVLDMCAAPGSKTAQIIEQLHSSTDPVQGAIPPGVVVANDADNKRCYLLTHQAKRLQSPSIMITNHDAAFMPNMHYTRPDGSIGKLKFDRVLCDVPCSGDGTLRKNCDVWAKWNPVNGANLHGLQLRIARRGLELLCVGGRMVYSTCSLSPMENEAVLQRLLLEADGALQLVDCSDTLPGLKRRSGLTKWCVVTKDMEVVNKPEDIPLKWSNVYHKHLFPVEKDLKLERCMRLLPHHQDTGGFFVAVLEKTALLPGEKAEDPPIEGGNKHHSQRIKQRSSKRRQGFKEEPYYYLSDSIADWEKQYRAGTVPDVVNSTTPDTSTVSDTSTKGDKEQNSASGALESETTTTNGIDNESEKIVTASEDEPGAVTDSEKKVSSETEAKLANESEAKLANETETDKSVNEAKPVGDGETNQETTVATEAKPTILNPEQEDLRIWSTISTFFGWRKDIPEASYTHFMTRSKEGKKRNLYFTNSLVRDLIDQNQDRMKIINTGVKVLVRTDNKGAVCDFRLAQEGIQSIIPLITLRRLSVTRADLLHLLNDDDNELPPELAYMSATCQQQAQDLVTGSVLLEYRGDPRVDDDKQDSVADGSKMKIELVGWKGKSSMRCYVARSDRIHYLRLLRADTSRYVKNKFGPAATPDNVPATSESSEQTPAVDETVPPPADDDSCSETLTKKQKLMLESSDCQTVHQGSEKMDTS